MRGSGEEAPGKRSGTGGGSIQWVVVPGAFGARNERARAAREAGREERARQLLEEVLLLGARGGAAGDGEEKTDRQPTE